MLPIMPDYVAELRKRVLIFDGSMGANLQHSS
jgi:methionine synthase I (cobalamin-dependent)